MKSQLLTGLAVALGAAAVPSPGYASFFPYPIHKKTLSNGLDVVVIPTPEFKDVLNWNTLILAGSRNEIERGRSGLAHLFEHIAFRHKFDEGPTSYDARIEKIGAFDNAWTWFDVTYYHPVTFASNLESLAELQAERMVAMDFSERIYRTEAGAVLGEYRRNASDPGLIMSEVLSDIMYGRKHGYGHTTMGYLTDVKDMPNSYRSGKRFYQQYYRPNNTVLVITGDVKPDKIFALVEKHYGKWRPRRTPKMPSAPKVRGPKRGHVPWAADVPPRLVVAYSVPPFDPSSAEGAANVMVAELLGGQTAPLYKKLRYEQKVATGFSAGGWGAMGFDRRPFEATVRFDKPKYDERGKALLEETEKEVIAGFEALKSFSKRTDADQTLAALKSKFRYDLLSQMSSPHDTAQLFCWYYRFNRSEKVFDELIAAIDALKPTDIDAFAKANFVAKNRAVVTMTYKGKTATAAK